MGGTLHVGASKPPWFGPRVVDDAQRCQAKAAISLRGWDLPSGVLPLPRAPRRGGWVAAANLLRALSFRAPTSRYAAGTHPVTDVGRLADEALPGESTAVKRFAATAVEALLDAQAAASSEPFDFSRDFMKTPFGAGEIHGGGVLAFAGPRGAWHLWRLRTGDTRAVDDRSTAWALIAAHVLHGHLEAQQLPAAGPVEVFECGAVTGAYVTLGSWATRDGVEAAYETLRQTRLRGMIADLETKPGSHCADCDFRGHCPSAPSIDGLLVGVSRQPHTVKITASDLRSYADCPSRYQLLHDDCLPGLDLTGEALGRGRRVDDWLTGNHRRGVACSQADVERLRRESGDDVAAAMAGHHLTACPFADGSTERLTVQADVVALDAVSGVLLVARPDATYQRDGRVVWRETKTRTHLGAPDARRLVETDITAAMYLTLLASGASGLAEALEWEELGEASGEITALPADDLGLVTAARQHLSAAIADVLADDLRSPRIGAACAECAARRWCPDAP